MQIIDKQKIYSLRNLLTESNKNEHLQISQYATLEYLDRVVKEVLRLYPSVPLIGRELIEELEINGVVLPVGTSVNLLIYDLHRDPNHFPDPLRFDPDRFLPELVEKRHPFAYLPFSAGSRNCIGNENVYNPLMCNIGFIFDVFSGQKFAVLQLKTVLIQILTNFELEPITRPEDMIFISDLTLHTNHKVKVKFVQRSNIRD